MRKVIVQEFLTTDDVDQAIDARLSTKADIVHTHAISDVTGLSAQLAVRPDTSMLGDMAYEDTVDVAHVAATGTPGASTVLFGDGRWDQIDPGNFLPDQNGNSGKVLSTDGTDPSWVLLSGGGDMLISTYDPNAKGADAFSMDNMVEGSDAKVMTGIERTRLSGMETGAQKNVKSDWNASSGDAEILNKPTLGTASAKNDSYFALASHSHAQSDITGLAASLSGKADAAHSHAQSDITGLATALSGKASTSHTHPQSDITGLAASLSGKADAVHSHAQSDITGLSTALAGKADASHSHAMTDVTGLVNALAGKQVALEGYNESLGVYESLANQITPISGIKGRRNPLGDQFYLEPRYGTGSDDIARGDHRHTSATLMDATHRVITSTTPRSSPGTSSWAFTALPVNALVAAYGPKTFRSDGIDWMYFHVPNVGPVWINVDHLEELT